MQIGLMQYTMTPKERMRTWQTNLCQYCGGTGHFLQKCPVRPSKFLSSHPTYEQERIQQQRHIILSISLQVAEGEVNFRVMVDSDVCSCFLDFTLAKKLQIPLRPKRLSLTIHLADGTQVGSTAQETEPILTITDSGHQDFLCFDVLHFPMIDWFKGEISVADSRLKRT